MNGLSPYEVLVYEVLVDEFLDKCPLPCGIGDSRSHLTMACPAASWAKTVPTKPIWKTNLSSANSSQTQPSMAPAPKWLCLTCSFLRPCAGLERSQYTDQSERKTDAGKKKSWANLCPSKGLRPHALSTICFPFPTLTKLARVRSKTLFDWMLAPLSLLVLFMGRRSVYLPCVCGSNAIKHHVSKQSYKTKRLQYIALRLGWGRRWLGEKSCKIHQLLQPMPVVVFVGQVLNKERHLLNIQCATYVSRSVINRRWFEAIRATMC